MAALPEGWTIPVEDASEDRYRIQLLGRRDFEELVCSINGDPVKLAANVPKGAKLRGVVFDFLTDSFVLRWEHESFSVVGPGCEIPRLGPMRLEIERPIGFVTDVDSEGLARVALPIPKAPVQDYQNEMIQMHRLVQGNASVEEVKAAMEMHANERLTFTVDCDGGSFITREMLSDQPTFVMCKPHELETVKAILEDTALLCECGAEKTGTTHSEWCPKKR